MCLVLRLRWCRLQLRWLLTERPSRRRSGSCCHGLHRFGAALRLCNSRPTGRCHRLCSHLFPCCILGEQRFSHSLVIVAAPDKALVVHVPFATFRALEENASVVCTSRLPCSFRHPLKLARGVNTPTVFRTRIHMSWQRVGQHGSGRTGQLLQRRSTSGTRSLLRGLESSKSVIDNRRRRRHRSRSGHRDGSRRTHGDDTAAAV